MSIVDILAVTAGALTTVGSVYSIRRFIQAKKAIDALVSELEQSRDKDRLKSLALAVRRRDKAKYHDALRLVRKSAGYLPKSQQDEVLVTLEEADSIAFVSKVLDQSAAKVESHSGKLALGA